MYFLIFLASSVILELKRPDTKLVINIFALLVFAFLLPFLAYHFVFLTSLKNSFFRSTPDVAVMVRYSRPLLFYAGLFSIPAILLLIKIADKFSMPAKKSPTAGNKEIKAKIKKQNKKPYSNIIQKLGLVSQVLVLSIISGLLIFHEYKPIEKKKIEIDFHASQQDWDKVVIMSKELEDYDRMVNFQFNRALLNTGQVLDRLFEYDQKLGSQGMFLDVPFTAEITLPNSDLYFDLGNIDESQRYAFESETLMRNSPRVLKRLILNCMIMDKMDAANTYINIIAANPMETDWVKKYRKYIDNPNLAASDSLIFSKRMDMSKPEGMLGTPPLKLLSQLEKNPLNKKAFEYLIAMDLLDHDLASFSADFKYINQFKYKKIPVIIEEAVLIFRSQGKGNEVLRQMRISEETVKRFREFAKLTSDSKGDRERAKRATMAYRNTYWYYVLFLSPKVTNLKLDTKPVEANY
jgi:hypothetical protein